MKKLKVIKSPDFNFRGIGYYACGLFYDYHPIPSVVKFLANLSRLGRSKNTIVNYSQDLKRFFSYLIEIQDLYSEIIFNSPVQRVWQIEAYAKNVNRVQIQAFFTRLNEERVKSSSQHRIRATLIEYYKFCFEIGLMDKLIVNKSTIAGLINNKKAQSGITTKVREQYIEPKDFYSKLLANVSAKSSFKEERDYIALLLRYTTSLRPHELIKGNNFEITKIRKLLAERKSSVSPIELSVDGKGEKVRKIIIPSEVARKINSFVSNRLKKLSKGIIFTKINLSPLKTDEFISNAFNNAVQRYVVSETDARVREYWLNLDPYCLRHSFATNKAMEAIKKGRSISELSDLMGHSDTKTTLNYIQFASIKIIELSDDKGFVDKAQRISLEAQFMLDALINKKEVSS